MFATVILSKTLFIMKKLKILGAAAFAALMLTAGLSLKNDNERSDLFMANVEALAETEEFYFDYYNNCTTDDGACEITCEECGMTYTSATYTGSKKYISNCGGC
jgi:hypothetical protein